MASSNSKLSSCIINLCVSNSKIGLPIENCTVVLSDQGSCHTTFQLGELHLTRMQRPCECIRCEHPSEDNVYKVEMISDDQVSALYTYSKRIFGNKFGEFRGNLSLHKKISSVTVLINFFLIFRLFFLSLYISFSSNNKYKD